LAWFTYQNADFLVTGRVLGQAALGAYGFAWTITSLPVEKITTLVIGVTPSILARAQDDRVLMRRYVKALTEGLALITFPLALGVALVASDFVPVVLGEKWRGVILPLQVLSLYMSVRSVTPLIAPVLNVSGASRHVMWNSLASAVVMPIAFIIGSHWGTVGIATAWVIASPFLLVPLYRDMFRVLQMSTREYVESLMPALSGCVVMALCVWAMRAMLGNQLPQLTRLIIQVAVGAIAYGTVMLTVHRARITNFIAAVRNAGA
jgi:PST family polysaccharide transporter